MKEIYCAGYPSGHPCKNIVAVRGDTCSPKCAETTAELPVFDSLMREMFAGPPPRRKTRG